MPIIQDYSDRNKLKANILTIFYVVLALTALIFLIRGVIGNNQENQTPDSTAKKNICVENDVSQQIFDQLTTFTQEDSGYQIASTTTGQDCAVIVARNMPDPNNMRKLFDTTYILVQLNPEEDEEIEVISNISQEELLNALIIQQLGEYKLLWDQQTDEFLKSAFDIGVGQIIYPSEEIANILQEESSLAIIPSQDREDWMNVVSIDEFSPYQDNFNPTRYLLIDRYWIGGTDSEDIDKIYGILVQ